MQAYPLTAYKSYHKSVCFNVRVVGTPFTRRAADDKGYKFAKWRIHDRKGTMASLVAFGPEMVDRFNDVTVGCVQVQNCMARQSNPKFRKPGTISTEFILREESAVLALPANSIMPIPCNMRTLKPDMYVNLVGCVEEVSGELQGRGEKKRRFRALRLVHPDLERPIRVTLFCDATIHSMPENTVNGTPALFENARIGDYRGELSASVWGGTVMVPEEPLSSELRTWYTDGGRTAQIEAEYVRRSFADLLDGDDVQPQKYVVEAKLLALSDPNTYGEYWYAVCPAQPREHRKAIRQDDVTRLYWCAMCERGFKTPAYVYRTTMIVCDDAGDVHRLTLFDAAARQVFGIEAHEFRAMKQSCEMNYRDDEFLRLVESLIERRFRFRVHTQPVGIDYEWKHTVDAVETL